MSKSAKALLTCPQCGHQQMESRAAFSAVCKQCGLYWRVQDMLKPPPKAAPPPPEQRRITCFECGAELDAPTAAQSTMCKKCSAYVDLHNYSISNSVSKNFRTKGSFVVEEAGYVFNTEALVSEAAIKGRFIGKLVVEHTLTLYSTAQIKGSLKADRLLLPSGNQVRFTGEIKAGSAEIQGELSADLAAENSVRVASTGRLFGKLRAASLRIDPGAVVAIEARIGALPQLDTPPRKALGQGARAEES